MVAKMQRYAFITVSLFSLATAAHNIGFVSRSRIPFLVSSRSMRHIKSTSVHHLHFRGGDIVDSSDDIQTTTTNIHDGKDESEKDMSDSAWDEEIKRLQMYLNSPQSRHGAGEDILVLGSRASTKSEADSECSKSLDDLKLDTLNKESISSEQLDCQSTYDVEPIPDHKTDNEQLDSISNENDMDEPDKIEVDAFCDESNDEMDPNDTTVEVDDQDTETATHHENSDMDVPVAQAAYSETPQDEIILDVDMDEATVKDDVIDQVANDDILMPSETQIITDHYSEALLVADSDLEEETGTTFPEDQSIMTNRWETAPTIAESNKLVEEGLSKLRRKDGDHPTVPYVITRAMKRVLIDDLGYEDKEVKAMRPDVAVVIVSENLKRPSIAALPSRFYQEDIIEPVQHTESLREILQSKIQTLVQKIDLKQSIIMIGSVLASYSVVSVFTNTNNKQQRHDLETISESPDSNEVTENQLPDASNETQEDEVIQKSDLDRTWLDRLISMLTFYK